MSLLLRDLSKTFISNDLLVNRRTPVLFKKIKSNYSYHCLSQNFIFGNLYWTFGLNCVFLFRTFLLLNFNLFYPTINNFINKLLGFSLFILIIVNFPFFWLYNIRFFRTGCILEAILTFLS